ncbi:uncharacterized protein BKA55DRAFT_490656, partial [Fusarium redolens]
MLLKHFLLGALLALSSVAALPNPEADLHDIEARDDKHHRPRCGKDADPDRMNKHKCICKDEGKEFDPEHKKCRCPKDQMPDPDDPHKCVCKDEGKEFDPEHKKCRCPKDQRPDRDDPHKCVCKDRDKEFD